MSSINTKRIKKVTGNQWKADPRQSLFLSLYLDPGSETFGNAYQSAIKAKYSEDYARTLSTPSKQTSWFAENVNKSYLVKKAESNLKDFLELKTTNGVTTKDGELKEFEDAGLNRVKADMTKFTLEKLKKDEYGAKDEQNRLQPIEITIKNGY